MRKPTRERLGVNAAEFALLRRLDTPHKIQAFVARLRQNFAVRNPTCDSVRGVLARRRAHCIEAALVAAAALWLHGELPLVLALHAADDQDHVVALFRRHGRWGAISKANGIGLRGRDAVYRSLRELVMSWFHEYSNAHGRKSLRAYSPPLDLRSLDPRLWLTSAGGAWAAALGLRRRRRLELLTPKQAAALARRDPFERRIDALGQYRKPRRRLG